MKMILLFVSMFFPSFVHSETDVIRPEQAIKYLDREKTVCGRVVSSKYGRYDPGQPTFLYFGKPYPLHSFGAIIPGKKSKYFGLDPGRQFTGKDLCVTGNIELYRGKAHIQLNNPSQIRR